MPPETKMPDSAEIDQALKEFEMKSNQEQTQQTTTSSQTSEIPKMVQLVMKYSGGAIKEQRQAEYVLLGFVFVVIAISLYLFFGGTTNKVKSPTFDLINRPQPKEGSVPEN